MEDKSVKNYKEGYNCAQAILKAAVEELDLERSEKLLLTVSNGLGTGMFVGETCGAVTGSIMALALKFGTNTPRDMLSTKRLYKKIKSFETLFKEKNHSLNCKELKTKYKANCTELIKNSAELLKEQLNIKSEVL